MIYPSQARKESMALALAELDKVDNPTIVEVGRMRNQYAGESDGHSTLVFHTYLAERETGRGGTLLSLDKEFSTQSVVESLGMMDVSFINAEAIGWFENHKVMRIDLLYLDGWDLDDPNSAKQHLLCFLLAEPMIALGGLVMIDDTSMSDLGKGKLVVPVAVLMGWGVLHKGYQSLLRKSV